MPLRARYRRGSACRKGDTFPLINESHVHDRGDSRKQYRKARGTRGGRAVFYDCVGLSRSMPGVHLNERYFMHERKSPATRKEDFFRYARGEPHD